MGTKAGTGAQSYEEMKLPNDLVAVQDLLMNQG
jgi:hypothetical protein